MKNSTFYMHKIFDEIVTAHLDEFVPLLVGG